MASDNFDACYDLTMKWEKGPGSGWSDNPKDPGGDTMCGCTLATYSRWLKRPATPSELRNIPATTLREIYGSMYWKPIGGDLLPRGVDAILLDIGINSGDGREHVWAHQTSNLAPMDRIIRLDEMRRSFWRHLPTFVTFHLGWFRREDDVFATAKRMCLSK